MSFPFFQGSIEDLLNVAGAGQGSFILGQLMRAQQQQQAADLDKSVLNNLSTRQEMDQKKQQFPLDLEKMRAEIERIRTTTGLEGERTRELQRNTQIFDAAGGAKGAAEGVKAERSERLAKALKAMRNEFEDSMQSIEYTNPQDMQNKVINLANRYEMPEAIVQNMLQATGTPEGWKRLQQLVFDNSDKGREIKAKAEEARTTALAVQEEMTKRATAAALVKLEQAKIGFKQNPAQAWVEAMKLALDPSISEEARAQANRVAAVMWQGMTEGDRIKAQQGLQGKVDLSGIAGVPTNPPAAPTPAPQAGPGGTIAAPATPQATTPPPGAVKRIQ